MARYREFIHENVAPLNARRIGIYDGNGNRVGQIPLGSLTPPTMGKKLYSFGALSDVHIGYDTAASDFQRALSYLAEVAEFVCISGDLTGDGSDAQLAQYKAIVDGQALPVYAVTGNHEAYDGRPVTTEKIQPYTGHPLYYSFEYGNDVFIMVGTIGGESYSNGVVFAERELQWLHETLEANRNKRCFVFQHIFAGVTYATSSGYATEAVCGNAGGLYTNWCWHDTAECSTFENLMKQYPNVVWFHGHSHLRYSMQKYGQLYANYSDAEGYKEVHIPSLAVPRQDDTDGDGKLDANYNGSEGYVVDVYENGIHLRGRDFIEGVFLPIASYWIDTTP
jgi:3',5'-cyclic AMP phosphodiesterase CpdA